jgi:membrane protein DedA with SNARE-associated domain
LIDQLITWLVGLPPAELYGAIALLAGLENIVPPVPADTVAALGAFLAAQGVLHPWGVYVATLVPNVVTAAGMFFLARTTGRAFQDTPLGRRFFGGTTMQTVGRLYERHHFWGIFASRFLPGYRAVVPPFAGLVGLGAWRALTPVVLASSLWYGFVCFVGYHFGRNWHAVRHALRDTSVLFGLLALATTAAIVWAVWRHRRRRRSADGA